MALLLSVAAFLLSTFPSFNAEARDWYVSRDRGKGKNGTREKPAKDLGNIASKLAAGDVIHIAAGTYVGKGNSGSTTIKVPVRIIGGYDQAFARRDPWGAHRTVLTGKNPSKNYTARPTLEIDLMRYNGKEMPEILVDGVIVDNQGRNRYKTDKKLVVLRRAKPGEFNPSPSMGAIVINVSKSGNYDKGAHWKITVKNCVVMNSHGTSGGAITVGGYKNSRVLLENNLVAQNSGDGIFAKTVFRPRDGKNQPNFTIKNNTVLFTWKENQMATSYSGISLRVDDDTRVTASGNVFAFADRIGVQKGGKVPLKLKGNLITGNLKSDFWETSGDAKIDFDDLEDEAEYTEAEENVNSSIKVPVSKAWAEAYGARVLINRAKLEAKVKAKDSRANKIRGMLGLALQAGTVKGPRTEVWLHAMSVDDAIKAGGKRYLEKYGCKKP